MNVDDHRFLSKEFMQHFKEPILEYIVKKVKTDKKQRYILCFRGNSGSTYKKDGKKYSMGSAIIYFNNHTFLQIDKKRKSFVLKISLNHAKKIREKIEDILKNKLGFILTNINADKLTYRYAIREFVSDSKMIPAEIDMLFDIIQEMMDEYFSVNDLLEKRRQQELFSALKNTNTGLFIYDLEYERPHINKIERDKNEWNNKADFLAIEYKEQQPISIVFGEVKSTQSACCGKSGIEDHLDKMTKFVNAIDNGEESALTEINARREDVKAIFKEYQELGLYKITQAMCDRLDACVYTMPVKIELIFTDDAIDYWKNDKAGYGKKMIMQKGEYASFEDWLYTDGKIIKN